MSGADAGAIARKWREITSTHPNDKGSVIIDARDLNALCLAVLSDGATPPPGESRPGDGGFPVRAGSCTLASSRGPVPEAGMARAR